MKIASVSEAKNSLSALLDRVKAGESVLITERGMPVARLEPVRGDEQPSGRTERLVRAGLMRVGSGDPPIDVIRTPGPRLPVGIDAVAMMLEDRRSGQ
jgi:prevent-host-death family protein